MTHVSIGTFEYALEIKKLVATVLLTFKFDWSIAAKFAHYYAHDAAVF